MLHNPSEVTLKPLVFENLYYFKSTVISNDSDEISGEWTTGAVFPNCGEKYIPIYF